MDEMDSALAAFMGSDRSGKTEHELDRAFHLALARGAHNDILYRSMSMITEQMSTQLWMTMKERSLEAPGRAELFHRDHVAILEAVRSRDHRKAAQAMLAHLKGVERSFLKK
jgi:DNA-binding FadR family transcriptional regulator